MPRLFVAIDLPGDVKAELIGLQPPRDLSIRLVKPDQLHLTLHFLGDAELEPTVAVLTTVTAPAFSISLEDVGQFSTGRGPIILWAGIRDSYELKSLHADLAEALRSTGYRPETRPFSPHITLARCQPETPLQIVDEFLMRNTNWRSPLVPVNEFALYSSVLTPDGPVYRRSGRSR